MTEVSSPAAPIDPLAPPVREGFLRLVARLRIAADRLAEPIDVVTRRELGAPTPILPVADPELALLAFDNPAATVDQQEEWASRRDQLRADIAGLRAELLRRARVIKDPALVEILSLRATEAAAFDPQRHALPLPEDDDLDTVVTVLDERIAVVGRQLASVGATVDSQVMLRSFTDTHRRPEDGSGPTLWRFGPRSRAAGDTEVIEDAGPAARQYVIARATGVDPEIELVDRLLARDPASRTAAAGLLARIFWQRETLRQIAVDTVVRPVSQPTKSIVGFDDPAVVIARLHLELLTASINLSHAVVVLRQTAPTGAPEPAAGDPARGEGFSLIEFGASAWAWLTRPAPGIEDYDGDNVIVRIG